jgi:hypothetical protein
VTSFPAGIFVDVQPWITAPFPPAYFSEMVAIDRQLCWMVEFDGDTVIATDTIIATLEPAGYRVPGEFGAAVRTVLATSSFRYATVPFVSSPTDTPANTPVEGRSEPVRVERRLEIAPNGAYSSIATSAAGEVQLANADAALDPYLGPAELALEGREIRLSVAPVLSNLQGERVPPDLADFNQMFVGLIDGLSWTRDSITIRVTDDRVRLNAPVQQHIFTGGGGLDGTADLAGVTRPLAYGTCFNISPVLIDPFRLIYQWHDGEARAVDAAYDKGVVLTEHSRVETYEALAAMQPVDPVDAADGAFTIGTYVSCPKFGCLRLGGIPAGRVTADVRGSGSVDAAFRFFVDGRRFADGRGFDSGGGLIHAHTVPQVAITLLRNAGVDNLNVNQFAQLDEDEPRDVGLFLEAGGNRTVTDCVAYVLAGNGCFLFRGPDGFYQLRRLLPPSRETVNIEADAIVAGSMQRMPPPWGQPWPRWRVRYARNWTVMNDGDLAPAVDNERKVFFKREAAEAEIVDDVTVVAYPARGPGLLDTALVKQKDAEAQARRMRDFYARGRVMYQFSTKNAGYRADLGDTIRVQYPRFTTVNGGHFTVVALREDGVADETQLTVYG